MTVSHRAGRYITQPQDYKAFVPAPLPPDPPVAMGPELLRRLSEADRGLGRLDGATSILPNPDLFVGMYVRQEAVLSSQIEGTQSTLEDVLEYEATGASDQPKDVADVVNYVRAMNYGLERLADLPLSLRLIGEIHARLLEGVRGGDRTPGEFRRSQNWIGPPGSTLDRALFVPPPVHEMQQALDNLEKFLHQDTAHPLLIRCGLAHAQFETVHPFLDGNGRMGRLLITFLLCWRGALHRPLLYLSLYLKAHRAEYYDRLQAVRTDGDWEGWLRFFLAGVAEVATEATETARAILDLREEHHQRVGDACGGNGLRLLAALFETPVVTARIVQERLGCAHGTASSLASRFEELGLLRETTGQQRNRRYRYEPYLKLFPRA